MLTLSVKVWKLNVRKSLLKKFFHVIIKNF